MQILLWISNLCIFLLWMFNISPALLIEQEDNKIIPNLPGPESESQHMDSQKQPKTNICLTSSNVRVLDYSKMNLTFLPHDYFDKCTDLRKIVISNNELTTLASNIFANNFVIHTITISGNYFTSIDPEWFQSCASTLQYLDISDNLLTVLPLEQLPTIPSLVRFHVSQNHLIDIDETQTVKKFPQLRHLEFQFNQIGCRRHQDLIKYFDDNNINTTTKGFNISSKNVRFEQLTDTGCIKEMEWMYLMLTNKPMLVFKPLGNNKDTDKSEKKDEDQGHNESTDNLMLIISSAIFVSIFVIIGALLVVIIRKLKQEDESEPTYEEYEPA